MHLPVRINFATGGAALDSEAQMMIQQAVATLRARPDVVRIRVEGHTDSRGPDASNDQLSLERAQAVVNYMVTLGVSPNILEAQGFGATQPITSDTREMDRAQNRRVEFSVLARGAGMTPAPTYP